jgi:SGNH domain (fused to AT3 domains)
VLDFADAICPGGMCVTHNGRIPVYRDGAHITVDMSRDLEPQFSSVLAQASDERHLGRGEM